MIGKEENKIFRTFTWASPANAKKMSVVGNKFEEYCIPRNTLFTNVFFSSIATRLNGAKLFCVFDASDGFLAGGT